MLREITIKNLLSFGPDTPPLELRPLNILIGANGSGKSNLIECISVMAASPQNVLKPILVSGGFSGWIYKGASAFEGSIETHVSMFKPDAVNKGVPFVSHKLKFGNFVEQLQINGEWINLVRNVEKFTKYFEYDIWEGFPKLAKSNGKLEEIRPEDINNKQSVLNQFRDPKRFATFTQLTNFYESVQFYREWSFGRKSALRIPQPTYHPSSLLKEGGENFAIILNNLRSKARKRIMKALEALFPGIEDFSIKIINNTAEFFLTENSQDIPATRLSDGTMRYLCLLAILCNPEPPPLIVIEEPELGLHPDVIGEIAKLLKEASERTQLIITTHSEALVDAFSKEPESIIVFEKGENGSIMQRLKKDDLDEWLKKYSLGNLWTRGQIGGTRW